MALQLPERGAPPPPNSDIWPSMATAAAAAPITSTASRARRKSSNNGNGAVSGSGSNKTRTARPPASPFIVSGKAASSPMLPSKARSLGNHHGHAHAAHSAATATATAGHEEISNMTDIRRLEDMLSHNESLLTNAALCAQLPGGQANVVARNKAMKDRLEHLYAMHAINIQMQDRVAINADNDEDPFMDEEIAQSHTVDSNSINVKQEDERKAVKTEHQSSPRPDGSFQFQNHINGSPSLSSSPTGGSPGAFHRHWRENIANRTTMVGKVGQLSMDESLHLLQTKANHRLRAQAELDRLASEGGRGMHSRRTAENTTGDVQTTNSAEHEYNPPEEEEDYDWHAAGYYYNNEDA